MSKFKTMVRRDIEFCDELINKKYAAHTHVQELIGKYIIDYPDFNKELITYASIPGREINELENIKIIKAKLQYLLNRVDNPDIYNKSNSSGVYISTINKNENNNNNLNVVSLNMSIEEIKENIDNNTYLSDSSKIELLKKLDEIVELQKSKDTKAKKWDKAKKIMEFLLDKGADIAIMYIPQILIALNK